MDHPAFWLSLYLGGGALLGHFHLYRCGRCGNTFEGLMDHTIYTMLSALFGIPILLLWAALAAVSSCGGEGDE